MKLISLFCGQVRHWLVEFKKLPAHPYSSFYAPWEVILQQQMMVRQYDAQLVCALGLQRTSKGWSIASKRYKYVDIQ
jgi:hypothetical protein